MGKHLDAWAIFSEDGSLSDWHADVAGLGTIIRGPSAPKNPEAPPTFKRWYTMNNVTEGDLERFVKNNAYDLKGDRNRIGYIDIGPGVTM